MPDKSKQPAQAFEDDVLRRLLKTPPQPHKAGKARKKADGGDACVDGGTAKPDSH